MSLFRRLEGFGEQAAATGLQPLYLPGLRYSLRMVDEDTLEVARIDNGIIRAIMWFAFWLTAFFVFRSWWEQDVLWDNVRIWLDSKQFFRETLDAFVKRNPALYGDEKFEDFYARMMRLHGGYWIGGMIYLALPSFFFYCAAVWPRYRPVRFDRRHRVAYAWSWGRFFMSPLPDSCADLDFTLRGTSADPFENMRNPELMGYGPLIVRLRHHRRTRYKERWPLGVFPPSHAGQNSQIAFAVTDFMTSHQRPEWCDRLAHQEPYTRFNRFLMWAFNFSLLPTWWPRRTKRLIQAHTDRIQAARETLRRKANGME